MPTPDLTHRIAKALQEALEAKGKLERCEVDAGMYDLIETAKRVVKVIEEPATPVSFRPQ